MSNRIYLTRTPDLDEAIKAAPAAGVVEARDAPDSAKARAWALYGYQRWLEDEQREQKIAAYEAIGADDEHLETVRAANLRAAETGIL
jgi:hypothetical protein